MQSIFDDHSIVLRFLVIEAVAVQILQYFVRVKNYDLLREVAFEVRDVFVGGVDVC